MSLSFAIFTVNRSVDGKSASKTWNGTWHGDVWKAIVHFRSIREDLQVQVFDCDFGIGIVKKGKPESMLSFDPREISAMSYEDLEKNRREFLNLKHVNNTALLSYLMSL
ncbi:hypothetical protein GCM10023231_14000 [Olivibacter ginsenosidimutans]|uniref:Uncharacterized protein n=1 Tax=Olivibacter ginsenosidimutans TaxID=1176537 RepID=A0ABP9AW26_9SPHI